MTIQRLRTIFAEYNPRRIPTHDYEELRWSIRTFGYVQLVVCNKRTRAQGWPAGSAPCVVGGHQGIRASEDEGLTELPIHWVDADAVLERKLNFILNRVHGEFIAEQVEADLRWLRDHGDALDHVGFTEDEIQAYFDGSASRRSVDLDAARQTLRERFVVPPFSVLDARQGYWRSRKAAWLALGIQSEVGRGRLIPGSTVAGAREGKATAPRAAGNYVIPKRAGRKNSPIGNVDARSRGLLLTSDSARDPSFYPQKCAVEKRLGRKLSTAEFQRDFYEPNSAARAEDRTSGLLYAASHSGRDPAFYEQKRALEKRLGQELSTADFIRDHYVPNEGTSGLSISGTSVFDPVLCELVYRWFCPPGGRVLDPLAGGSVRGIVAGALGRRYVGIELRSEQVEANRTQAAEILVAQPEDAA